MKASEYATCKANGAADVIEAQVGIDGIAFAEAKNGPRIALTTADIYKALAANPRGKPNAAKTWKDVNPALPAIPIQVYGPPSTSGRSEEHTSELQSLMRISYAVLGLKKTKNMY